MDLFKSIGEDKIVDSYVELSFDIIDALHVLMTTQKVSVQEVANAIEASKDEVEAWLSGVHDFTLRQIAALSICLNHKIISVNVPQSTEPLIFTIPNKLVADFEREVIYADGYY